MRHEKRLLLLAGADHVISKSVQEVAGRTGDQLLLITEDLYHVPLGMLAGRGLPKARPPLAPRGAAEKLSEPVLILSGYENDNHLDTTLKALRTAGVNLPLKAILTEANASWNVIQLFAEMSREREHFSRR